MNKNVSINEIKLIVKGRFKLFFVVFLSIVLCSVVISLILPPVYRSEAVIRIDQQQVSEDLLKITVTGYAAQRLEMISAKVLSYKQLGEVIKELNPYPQLYTKMTMGEMITRLKKSIEIETKDSNIINKSGERLPGFTTAFSLSYEGQDPMIVQKVTNKLASLFIEEDSRSREKLALGTTTFFAEEIEALKTQIAVHEDKIKKYKEMHIGELPEYTAMNLRAVDRLQRELDNVLMRIRSLEDKKIYLKGQIATVDPLLPIITDQGRMVMNPNERLKRYRLDLLTLESTLSVKHPDVVKLIKTIKELEASIGETDDSAIKIRRLVELRGELATLRGKYGAKHPDVGRVENEINNLSIEVDKLLTEKAEMKVESEKPDSPLYISLMTQIVSADTDIKGFLKDKVKIEKEIDKYSNRIEIAPLVEKEYNELTRDYERAKHKYSEIKDKLMEAKLAQGLDETQRGERFSIMGPAYTPGKPIKPNRFAIVLLGIMLGLGIGISLAAIQEGMDNTLKSADELNSLTGVSVFSVIPKIETNEERRMRRIKKLFISVVIIGSIALILFIVSNFIAPFDVLMIKLQQRIAIM